MFNSTQKEKRVTVKCQHYLALPDVVGKPVYIYVCEVLQHVTHTYSTVGELQVTLTTFLRACLEAETTAMIQVCLRRKSTYDLSLCTIYINIKFF